MSKTKFGAWMKEKLQKLIAWWKAAPKWKKILVGVALCLPFVVTGALAIIFGIGYAVPRIPWKGKKKPYKGKKNPKETDVFPKKPSEKVTKKLKEIEKDMRTN